MDNNDNGTNTTDSPDFWWTIVSDKSPFKKLEQGNSSSTTNSLPVHCVSLLASGFATLCGLFLLMLIFRRVICLDRDFRIMFANLTCADLITASGLFSSSFQHILYKVDDSTSLCIAQSYMSTASAMASFFWTIVIGIVCFKDVLHHDVLPPPRIKTTSFFVLHILCWGIPIAIMSTALAEGALGENDGGSSTGGWCWIRSCDDTCSNAERVKLFLWMLFTGKLWEFLSYLTIVNIFILGYFLHVRKSNAAITDFAASIPQAKIEEATHRGILDLNHSTSTSQWSEWSEENADNEAKLLFWIPVALVFARIWGTIRFTFDALQLFQPSVMKTAVMTDFNNTLVYFQAIGDCSQTTCNFILVVIFSVNVRNFLCCRPWRSKCYESL